MQLQFLLYQYHHILSGTYEFVAGCNRGTVCAHGRYCGDDYLCNGCTFEECEKLAVSNNVDGFAYRGTSGKYCRKCSKDQLNSLLLIKDYGVYRKKYLGIILDNILDIRMQ